MPDSLIQSSKCRYIPGFGVSSGSVPVALLLCMQLVLLAVALLLSLSDNSIWYLLLALTVLTAVTLVLAFKHKAPALSADDVPAPLQTVIDALSDAVIATDTEGRIIIFNPCAEELTGFKLADALGEPIDHVCHFLDMRSGEEAPNPVREALDNNDIVILDDRTQILSQDDEQYFVAGSATPVYGDHSQLSGVVLVMRDVSDQIKLQRQLSHADKMRSVGELAGGIAHDFNNMLGAIMGAAQVLDTLPADKQEKHQEYIQIIMRVSENAAELIRNLLAFSRNAARENAPMSVNNVIEQTVNMLQYALRKDINIQTDLTKNRMNCSGDQVAIQSMIMNLCINAQDAMPQGGVLHISTRVTSLKHEDWQHSFPHINSGLYAEIRVKDEGCGMSADLIGRIFEPFFTTKDRGKGTGLGLAMVYGTINAHGGCIKINSTPGKGSTFHLYLPLKSDNSAPESSSTLRASLHELQPAILLIDDDNHLRPIMHSLIEGIGQNVISAANGKHGLEIYKKHARYIKLVLLDLVMQEMSGRAVFEKLHALNPDIKVVLISGYDRGADAEYLLESGAVAYLRKPFSMQELLDIFHSHL